MKKHTLPYLVAAMMMFVACDSFDTINTNPDSPTEATPELLARRVIYNMSGSDAAKTTCLEYMKSKYMAWWEGSQSEQYNHFGQYSFSGYTILTTAQKMKDLSVGTPDENQYHALYLFLKAYKLYHLTMNLGDIPYSEALQGEADAPIYKPKYDTQKEVFTQIIADLDQAHQLFTSASGSLAGDIIYGGDIKKWAKAVRVFQMKVLLSMSKKESEADLNVKSRFAAIVFENKLFESNSDNFQLVYANKTGMINPFHITQTKHADYIMLSTTLVDSLKKYDDYRLFYYARPAEGLADTHAPDSYDAYVGVDVSLEFSQISTAAAAGLYCKLNLRYTQTEKAEPFVRLSYSDQNFMLAEAALRKWITADPQQYYLQGIRAGMMFTRDATDNEHTNGRPITDTYIENHISQPQLALTGAFEGDLNKIITQKYLTNFLQNYDGDAYFDYRRTGYPEFPINPNSSQNEEQYKDRIPVRHTYPLKELGYNNDNVAEAINRQFNGNDNPNELMWLLK